MGAKLFSPISHISECNKSAPPEPHNLAHVHQNLAVLSADHPEKDRDLAHPGEQIPLSRQAVQTMQNVHAGLVRILQSDWSTRSCNLISYSKTSVLHQQVTD